MFAGVSPLQAALSGAAFLLALLSGCAGSNALRDASDIAAWATERGFAATSIEAGVFRLAAFTRRSARPAETLNIYIEGDGAAWPTPFHAPRDPTPADPVALRLAAADPAAAVLYLARPCQYLDAAALAHCDSAYWTERRFAPEVLAAYDAAIDRQKSALAARRIRLFGYSGGGVLAALLAARRDDVDLLVTVAAPVAVGAWLAWHEATPLPGSLDPLALDQAARLPPGVHFVGADDKTVPPAVVEQFVRRHGGRLEIIAGFDHDCCWARDWAALLGRVTLREDAK